MKQVQFDFDKIGTIDDFYAVAQKQLNLPEHFGKNLDALWDSVTGDIALPVSMRFSNMSLQQLESFSKLINLFEDAADELADELEFTYYLKK